MLTPDRMWTKTNQYLKIIAPRPPHCKVSEREGALGRSFLDHLEKHAVRAPTHYERHWLQDDIKMKELRNFCSLNTPPLSAARLFSNMRAPFQVDILSESTVHTPAHSAGDSTFPFSNGAPVAESAPSASAAQSLAHARGCGTAIV